MYDYLIVGAGLFGATFANLAKEAGKKCLIIEKRNHIAGNCYTTQRNGIHIHEYGPHTFHTSNKEIWDYVNKFAEFNTFSNRAKVFSNKKLYSFPINLFTLYQLWGCTTPEQAKQKLESVKIPVKRALNLEEYILSKVGAEIYYKFIYGYTKKQWGNHPKLLPASIVKRLPIRLTFDDNYYYDTYQGIPINGYTSMIENMIGDVPVELNVNYLDDVEDWNSKADKVVYTGALDELFNYEYGSLDYRSLRFEHVELDQEDFQGNAIIHYADENIPYTRIIEHKHFMKTNEPINKTIITYEYPQFDDKSVEKYYPVNNTINELRYELYKKVCNQRYPNLILGGRLASYKYMDMHQVIGQAMHKFKS